MNVKKEVYERCKGMIEKEISGLKCKISRNKYEINKLANEQAVNKREIGKLYEILRDFSKKEKR